MKARWPAWKPACKIQEKRDAPIDGGLEFFGGQSHHKIQRIQALDMLLSKCEVLCTYIHV